MNITILCGSSNSSYARDVLRAINERGLGRINVVAAVNSGPPRTVKSLWAKYGWTLPWAMLRSAASRLVSGVTALLPHDPKGSLEEEVRAEGGRLILVQDLNGEACRWAVEAMQVDLMILAGTPIIRAPILKVPKLGTLNAHQGALPAYRGMNVIEWAILEGASPAVSIHFVDPGVDTGDIVIAEKIPIVEGDTFASIRFRAGRQQCEMLARAARQALSGPLTRRPQRAEEGRQFYSMHPRLKAIAEIHLPA